MLRRRRFNMRVEQYREKLEVCILCNAGIIALGDVCAERRIYGNDETRGVIVHFERSGISFSSQP
jgi:hypothetical protein